MYYIYARTSTKEQRYGLETQLMFLRDNVPEPYKQNKIIEVVEQLSGASLEGRKLALLIEGLLPGDILAVYDTSRLARNTEDLLVIIRQVFAKGSLIIIGLQIIDKHNFEQELQFTISGAIATYQRKVQNAKSRAAIKVKKMAGQWKVKGNQFGYYFTSGKSLAQIKEQEALIIRYIFSNYLLGKSTIKLREEIKQFPLDRPYPNETSIRRYLLNPLFMGYQLIEGINSKTRTDRTILKTENLIKSRVYPEIISPELFWSVQKNYREITRKHSRQFSQRYSPYQLSSIMSCGYCGARYVHSFIKRGEKIYDTYQSKVHKTACGQHFHTFSSDQLEMLFTISWCIYLANPDEIKDYYRELNKNKELEIVGVRARILILQEALNDLNAAMDKIVSQVLEFKGSLKIALQEKADEIDVKKSQVIQELNKLQNEIEIVPLNVLYEYVDNLIDKYKNSDDEGKRDLYKQNIFSAEVIDGVIDIIYNNGKNIEITLMPRAGRRKQYIFNIQVSYLASKQYEFSLDTREPNFTGEAALVYAYISEDTK